MLRCIIGAVIHLKRERMALQLVEVLDDLRGLFCQKDLRKCCFKLVCYKP